MNLNYVLLGLDALFQRNDTRVKVRSQLTSSVEVGLPLYPKKPLNNCPIAPLSLNNAFGVQLLSILNPKTGPLSLTSHISICFISSLV